MGMVGGGSPVNENVRAAKIVRFCGEHKANAVPFTVMDEGRKRVIGLMAAILASLHMQTADDLFGGPQGSPQGNTEIRWAKE